MNCAQCGGPLVTGRKYCSTACYHGASKGVPNPKNAGPRRPLVEQLWEKVDVRGPDECWPWTGATDPGGYGRIVRCGKEFKAHRVSYALNVGPIPEGLDVLHTCDNPPCCNPAHLWTGTQLDNNRDRMRKGRNRQQHGEHNSNVKLTGAEVAEIRERYAAGGETQTALAAAFGIKQPQVSRIVRGATW